MKISLASFAGSLVGVVCATALALAGHPVPQWLVLFIFGTGGHAAGSAVTAGTTEPDTELRPTAPGPSA